MDEANVKMLADFCRAKGACSSADTLVHFKDDAPVAFALKFYDNGDRDWLVGELLDEMRALDFEGAAEYAQLESQRNSYNACGQGACNTACRHFDHHTMARALSLISDPVPHFEAQIEALQGSLKAAKEHVAERERKAKKKAS